MKHLIALLTVFAVLAPAQSSATEPGIVVRKPWIREAPPPARVLAAYMIIDNTGATPVTISRISSPDFQRTQLHRTHLEGGVASMVPVAALHIPAGESVALLPGGMHLMLFDPLRPLHAGDSVTLVIHDAAGSNVTVEASVVSKTGEASPLEHHH